MKTPTVRVAYLCDSQKHEIALFDPRVALEVACNLVARDDVEGVMIYVDKPVKPEA